MSICTCANASRARSLLFALRFFLDRVTTRALTGSTDVQRLSVAVEGVCSADSSRAKRRSVVTGSFRTVVCRWQCFRSSKPTLPIGCSPATGLSPSHHPALLALRFVGQLLILTIEHLQLIPDAGAARYVSTSDQISFSIQISSNFRALTI